MREDVGRYAEGGDVVYSVYGEKKGVVNMMWGPAFKIWHWMWRNKNVEMS